MAATEDRLPPIDKVREPPMDFTSTRIRWFLGLGYTVSVVAKHLGVKYQQVRNVSLMEPKRGAREALPELKVEVIDDE